MQERGPGFGAQTFTVMFEAEPGFSLHFAQDREVTPAESNHADRSLLVKNSQFQRPGVAVDSSWQGRGVGRSLMTN